jgi:hypothetical protein
MPQGFSTVAYLGLPILVGCGWFDAAMIAGEH